MDEPKGDFMDALTDGFRRRTSGSTTIWCDVNSPTRLKALDRVTKIG